MLLALCLYICFCKDRIPCENLFIYIIIIIICYFELILNPLNLALFLTNEHVHSDPLQIRYPSDSIVEGYPCDPLVQYLHFKSSGCGSLLSHSIFCVKKVTLIQYSRKADFSYPHLYQQTCSLRFDLTFYQCKNKFVTKSSDDSYYQCQRVNHFTQSQFFLPPQ